MHFVVEEAVMVSEGERRSINKKNAIACARAGLYVFPSINKTPIAKAWQRSDTAIGTDEAEEIRAEARANAVAEGRVFKEDMPIGATIDIAKIKAMWRLYPDAVPSISLGPSNLYVADCDIGSSRNGPQLFRQWCADNDIDISKCPVTRTQSGGEHIFFSGKGLCSHVGSEMGAIYVQIKATGNQVVAPGSVREDGKRYLSVMEHPALLSTYASDELPEVPPPLFKLQSERLTSNVADVDLAPVIGEMSGELPEIDFDPNKMARDTGDCSKSRYRLALDLARRNGDTFTPALYAAAIQAFDPAGELVGGRPSRGEYDFRQLAREFSKAKAEVADREKRQALLFGDVSDASDVSDTIEAAVLAVEAARDRNEDPRAEIERLKAAFHTDGSATDDNESAIYELDTAYMLGMDMCGPIARLKGGSIAAEKAKLDEPEHYREAKAKKAAKNAPLPWEDQDTSARLMRTHRVKPLVEGVLECGTISVVYGQSNVGKSFVVAGIGYAITCGTSWHVHATSKGAVLYVGLEGRSAFRRRVAALREDMASQCADPAIFATTQIDGLNLTAEGSEATRIIATASEIEAKAGLPVRLIVIDTLAAVTPGSDENSGRDMGAFVAEIKKISAACPGVHILIVHHTGKDQAKGARGHSSLRAAIDTELEIVGGEIRVTKQRDMEFAAAIGFRLETIALGDDETGRPLRSAVVRLHSVRGAVSGNAFGAVDEEKDEASFARATLKPEHRLVLDIAVETIELANGEAVTPAAIVANVLKAAPTMKDNTIRTVLRRRLASDGLLLRLGENYALPRPRETVS